MAKQNKPNFKMKGSEKIALVCIAFGLAVAFGVSLYLPKMTWVGWTLITLVVGGAIYPQLLQIIANEKIIDRGDWPNKE